MTLKKDAGAGFTASRQFAWYLIVLTLLLSAIQVRADLQFDAFVGYDQVLPEHGWFPITFELHNDGPSFNAVIEVTSGEWGGGQIRRLPIDLPTGTRKRVVMPVFSSGRLWNARLVDSRGNVRAEQSASNVKVIGNHLPLVAALTRTVNGTPIFPETKNSQWNSKYVAARLQSSLFPDNPLTLEGIDMLYISSEKAVELTLGQVTALEAWLQNGGHLVIGVEQISDIGGTPWLKEMLPCNLTSMDNVSAHESLLQWIKSRPATPTYVPPSKKRHTHNNSAPVDVSPVAEYNPELPEDPEFDSAPLQVATGTERDGAILIGDKAHPLAFEGRRGRGRVTALCFSPEREPFISWKDRAWFWARLAEVPAYAFQDQQGNMNGGQLSSDGIFGAMIDSRQIRKLPLGWLLALLAAYLIVIGPLDQWWLKKINRQMLTWITFPGYVLIFSGLIYWIGFHLRAGELEWNELSLIDVLPNNDRAVLRGQTYVSIYSPVNAHYDISSEQPFATLRGEYQGYYGGSIESSRLTLTQHGNGFEADASVPIWTSELYVSDWLQAAPLPLTMKADLDDSGWQVTVENKLDRNLSEAHVVLEGRIYALGDLPAEQSKTFTLKREDGKLLREWTQQQGNSFARGAMSRRNSFGNNEAAITDIANGSIAASFLSQVNQSGNAWETFTGPDDLDLTRFATPANGILLAWDPGHSMAAAINRFPVKRSHRNSLLRLVTPVNL